MYKYKEFYSLIVKKWESILQTGTYSTLFSICASMKTDKTNRPEFREFARGSLAFMKPQLEMKMTGQKGRYWKNFSGDFTLILRNYPIRYGNTACATNEALF